MCWANSRHWLRKWDEIPCSNIDCSIQQICSNCNDSQMKRHCCRNGHVLDDYRYGGESTYGDNPKVWNRPLMAHIYYNRKQDLIEAMTQKGVCTPKFLKYLMLSSIYDRKDRKKREGKLNDDDPFEMQSKAHTPPFTENLTRKSWCAEESTIYPILHRKDVKDSKKWIKDWYEFYRDVVAPHTNEWYDFGHGKEITESERIEQRLDIDPYVNSRTRTELYPATDFQRRSAFNENVNIPTEEYIQEQRPDDNKIEYEEEKPKPSVFGSMFYHPPFDKNNPKSYNSKYYVPEEGAVDLFLDSIAKFANFQNFPKYLLGLKRRADLKNNVIKQKKEMKIDEPKVRPSEIQKARASKAAPGLTFGDRQTGRPLSVYNLPTMEGADGKRRRSLLHKLATILDNSNEVERKSQFSSRLPNNEARTKSVDINRSSLLRNSLK